MKSLHIRWLGTACFEIRIPGGKTILIDPYLDDSIGSPIVSSEIESCHYILITHGHYDHILDVGKISAKFNSKIFCNGVAAESLIAHQGVSADRILRLTQGDSVQTEEFKIEVLKGRHNDSRKEYKRVTGREISEEIIRSDPFGAIKEAFRVLSGTDWLPENFDRWMTMYPSGEQLNFVIDIGGGKRIYMAGTCPEPDIIEEAKKAKAFITLLQVLSGDKLIGAELNTLELAVASGCKIAIPQHHDPLLQGAKPTNLNHLRELFEKQTDIQFVEVIPGVWNYF